MKNMRDDGSKSKRHPFMSSLKRHVKRRAEELRPLRTTAHSSTSTSPQHSSSQHYSYEIRDRSDATAKRGFRVQVPKRLLYYVMVIFFVFPLLLFLYEEVHLHDHSPHTTEEIRTSTVDSSADKQQTDNIVNQQTQNTTLKLSKPDETLLGKDPEATTDGADAAAAAAAVEQHETGDETSSDAEAVDSHNETKTAEQDQDDSENHQDTTIHKDHEPQKQQEKPSADRVSTQQHDAAEDSVVLDEASAKELAEKEQEEEAQKLLTDAKTNDEQQHPEELGQRSLY